MSHPTPQTIIREEAHFTNDPGTSERGAEYLDRYEDAHAVTFIAVDTDKLSDVRAAYDGTNIDTFIHAVVELLSLDEE